MKYKIWNKEDSLITPIGEVLTKEEIFAKYPMATVPELDFVICDATITLGVFMEYTQTKDIYRDRILEMASTPETTEAEKQEMIDEYNALEPQDVLDLITFMEENPPMQEATAEERIASALEFQNLLALPDEEA